MKTVTVILALIIGYQAAELRSVSKLATGNQKRIDAIESILLSRPYQPTNAVPATPGVHFNTNVEVDRRTE